jgi:hypothetical protein
MIMPTPAAMSSVRRGRWAPRGGAHCPPRRRGPSRLFQFWRPSGFERARPGNVQWRLFQSSGQAQRAGADPSKVVESVDARIVVVAPAKVKRIVPYRFNGHSLKTRSDRARRNFRFGGELVDAEGAGTFLPEVPRWVGTDMAVIPGDLGEMGADSLHQCGHEIGQSTPSLQGKSRRFCPPVQIHQILRPAEDCAPFIPQLASV